MSSGTREAIAAIADDPKAVFIALLARALHRSGVASDQLEETITNAAAFLGLQCEIFALPTNITLAVGPRYAQQIVMLRLRPARVDLRRLALLNELFDNFERGTSTLPQAITALKAIDDDAREANPFFMIVALAMVAIGVAVILGGGINELIVASLIGASTGVINALGKRIPVFDRLFEVIAAFIATLIVAAYTHVVGPTNLYISIVAGVVLLLPGYSLTLALHELANQDLIAGTARLGRVLVVLLSLGCGALLGFAVAGPGFLSAMTIRPHPVGAVYWIVAVALMSIGLSVDLNARLKDFAWVFFASFIAIATSRLFGLSPVHQIAAFLAAFACGMIANAGARFLRVPQPVILVPALNVLVPGSLSYESVLYVFSKNYMDAAQLAVNAVIAAILLVAGLLLSQLLFPATAPRSIGRSSRL